MTWWTATSVSVTNGQKIVSVTTGDDVQIAQEAGGLIIGNNPPVEIKRTFLDGTGAAKIELVLNWPYATQSAQPAVAFPTDADLAEATRILRSVGSDAVTFAEALAQVLGSTANTITVSTETSGDLTVTPYGKLTADVQALLNQLGDFGVSLYASATKNEARNKLGLKPQITAAATLDLDVTKGDYTVYESAALSFQKKTLAEAVTTTRTSSASVNTPFGIQTVGNNIARIEYDPTTGEPLGLLCEEQRTNIYLHSELFTDVGWSKTRCTVSLSNIVSPQGSNYFLLTATSPSSYISRTINTTADIPLTISCYAKFSGFATFYFRVASTNCRFNLGTGQFITLPTGFTGVSTLMRDGGYRISITWTPSATGTDTPQIGILDNASGDTVLITGAQLEVGSFPTSYIKTEGSQTTRVADWITRSTTNLSPSQGAIFLDLNILSFRANIHPLSIYSNSTIGYRKRIVLEFLVNKTFRVICEPFGTLGFFPSTTGKIAITYGPQGLSIFSDGVKRGVVPPNQTDNNSSFDVISLGRAGFFNEPNRSAYLFKGFKTFTAIPTDAELIALTTL